MDEINSSVGFLPKILICDEDLVRAKSINYYLEGFGFVSRICGSGEEAKTIADQWKPEVILSDLMLPGLNGFAFLDWLTKFKVNRPNLILMSDHNSKDNVEKAFRMGATDYLVKPVDKESLLGRVLFHSQKITKISEETSKKGKQPKHSLLKPQKTPSSYTEMDNLLELACSPDSLFNRVFNILKIANRKVNGVRTNLVQYKDQVRGIVAASNDNPKVCGLNIDLSKYPEILTAVNTKSTMIIENLSEGSPFASILDKLKNIQFNSLIVCPVFYRGKVFGTLTLRMQQDREITEDEVLFGQIVAKTLSLCISSENHLSFDNYKYQK